MKKTKPDIKEITEQQQREEYSVLDVFLIRPGEKTTIKKALQNKLDSMSKDERDKVVAYRITQKSTEQISTVVVLYEKNKNRGTENYSL